MKNFPSLLEHILGHVAIASSYLRSIPFSELIIGIYFRVSHCTRKRKIAWLLSKGLERVPHLVETDTVTGTVCALIVWDL